VRLGRRWVPTHPDDKRHAGHLVSREGTDVVPGTLEGGAFAEGQALAFAGGDAPPDPKGAIHEIVALAEVDQPCLGASGA